MIGYFDTSAIVPLLVVEPTSDSCRRLWDDCDVVVTCRIAYAEAAAAMAAARRIDRLTARALTVARRRLDDVWEQLDVVEVDDQIVRMAADLAGAQALRGYDAVHCACALTLADSDLVAAAGDRRLLEAWYRLGLATYATDGPDTRG